MGRYAKQKLQQLTKQTKNSIMNIFKKPTQQQSQDQNPAAPGSKPGRAPFLSPFVDTKGLPFKITSFHQGTTRFRLCPTFGPKDQGMTLDVKVLPVNYKQADGQIIDGRIVAGPWFWNIVNPFLIKNCKARFKTKSNPSGDVQFRTRTAVAFWAIVDALDENKQPVKQFNMVTLPGASYAGAPTAAGDWFRDGGEFFADFDADTGRELVAEVGRKDPRDPTTKTTVVKAATYAPDEKTAAAFKAAGVPVPKEVSKPAPIEAYMGAFPKEFMSENPADRPSLSDFVRESPIEEVMNCLENTLPLDIVQAIYKENPTVFPAKSGQ